MKLIIRPRYVTWNEAKAIANAAGGRLFSYRELSSWSNVQQIDIDIWIDRKMDDQGQYFDATKQDIRLKPLHEKCLLVFWADPKRIKSMREEAEEKEMKTDALRRRAYLKSNRGKREWMA